MPESIIHTYLSAQGNVAFDEIVSVFRHDFVGLFGMVHSWAVLVESEVTAAPDELFYSPESRAQFHKIVSLVERTVAQGFSLCKERLYITLDVSKAHSVDSLLNEWQRFYKGFANYAAPRLQQLEQLVRTMTEHVDFENVVQRALAPMPEDDRIDVLLLRLFSRLEELFDPKFFDKRIAEIVALY